MSKADLTAHADAMKTTLQFLAQEAIEIARLIVEADGELSPELEKRLDVNAAALARKVDSYVHIDETLEMHEAMWKQRAQACSEMSKRFAFHRERLRDRVKATMQEMGSTEIQGTFNRYKLTALKPKLVITDEKALPANLTMQIVTLVPDRVRIEQALQEGFEVPGAALEPVVRLNIYQVKE